MQEPSRVVIESGNRALALNSKPSRFGPAVSARLGSTQDYAAAASSLSLKRAARRRAALIINRWAAE